MPRLLRTVAPAQAEHVSSRHIADDMKGGTFKAIVVYEICYTLVRLPDADRY